MGEYCNTLRTKTIKATIAGELVNVNLFAYLCKPSYGGFLSRRRDTRTELGVARASALWADKPLPKYAVVAGEDYIKQPRAERTEDQCYPVYTNLKSTVWFDNGDFPGELVGFLHMCDGKVHGLYTKEQFYALHEATAKKRAEAFAATGKATL